MDPTQHLSAQLEGMERLVDAETGAILFRHPSLSGSPDLVLEGDGYTLEFNCGAEAAGYGSTLLCVDIRSTAALARLLAEPLKDRLPIAG